MAVCRQYGLRMTALTSRTVQFSPTHTLCGGCSENFHGGVTHETAGSSPAAMSFLKRVVGTIRRRRRVSQMLLTIRSGCTNVLSPWYSFQVTPCADSSLGSTLMPTHGHRS